MSAADLAWLRLARSRNVGPQTFARLLSRFGDAEAALEALPGLATRAGDRAYQTCSERQGRDEMERAEAIGARMLKLGRAGYPPLLAEIPDPPAFLWAVGDLDLLERPSIAVIGARNASAHGRRMARILAEGFGEAGLVVVSGFARGIDAAAHEAALPTGTVACMAGGVDVIYPEENHALSERMRSEGGLFLSEAPPGMQPLARHFPRRNRIVSGLARGVVLVEAAARSGSLITARMALEQGREVMAVPGSPLDARAEGCNGLIRQGAALIRNVEDALEALEGPHRPAAPAFEPSPAPAEEEPAEGLAGRALELLGPAATDADGLARELGVSAAALSAALLELELAGRIERLSGNMVARLAEP